MDVYSVTGKNYFANYFNLKYRLSDEIWDFSDGIEAWFSTSHHGHYGTADEFLDLVDCLRFFDIAYYDDISFSEFERYASMAHALYEAAEKHRIESDKLANSESVNTAIERYFNFDQYTESVFNELADRLILKQKTGTSIDELLTYSKAYPKDTYIVVLKRGKKVCYVARTTSPLQVIGSHHKKMMADSACVDVVDPFYADDLVLYLKLRYDLVGERATIYTGNRKYGTLKRAIYAYSHDEGMPKKRIMAAIEREKVRTYELSGGMVLVDKLELHRALFPVVKQSH